jgi:hypothetical protein
LVTRNTYVRLIIDGRKSISIKAILKKATKKSTKINSFMHSFEGTFSDRYIFQFYEPIRLLRIDA